MSFNVLTDEEQLTLNNYTLSDQDQSILNNSEMFAVVFQDRYNVSETGNGYIALVAYEELPKSLTYNPELIKQAIFDLKKEITPPLSTENIIFLLTYEYSFYDTWKIIQQCQLKGDLFIGTDVNPMKAMREATRKFIDYVNISV